MLVQDYNIDTLNTLPLTEFEIDAPMRFMGKQEFLEYVDRLPNVHPKAKQFWHMIVFEFVCIDGKGRLSFDIGPFQVDTDA